MDAGLAAILGALAGGAATFAATFFQARSSSRQQRVQTAATLAAKEHDFDVLLRAEGVKHPESFIAQYVGFHDAILRELEKGKGISTDQIEALAKDYGINVE